MTFRVEWHVVCDGCTKQSKHRDNNSDKAEVKCVSDGWHKAWYSFGMHHICPECWGKGNLPDWWPKEKNTL